MNERTAEILAGLERDVLLVAREGTHGPFLQQSAIWDQIMLALDWGKFKSPEVRLVVTMICVKLSRACCHPDVKDHWDDIAGYAKLGAETCEK